VGPADADDWTTTSSLLDKLVDFDQRTAWDLLADHWREALVRFAQRMGLDAADAQDAAQDTLLAFMEAYRGGRYRRGKGRLRDWLFGIARRQIQQARRRRATRRTVDRAERSDLTALLEEGDGDADSSLEWWEEEWQRAVFDRALRRVREEVSPQTFRIFRTLVYEEQPAEVVARRLGVPLTKVYNAKYRVSKRLGELVAQLDDA